MWKEVIFYSLKNNGVTVAAGKSVEGGVIGDDGKFYSNKLSDEFKRLEYKTFISEKTENKILRGELNSKKIVIGGHSPEINDMSTKYWIKETIKINPDGTRVVRYKKIFPDGTSSKLKKSIIFPETWSDTDIINSIKQIGDTEAIGVRVRDQTTIHRGTVNGVQIEVMKIGSYTTSGYPTGGYPMDLIKNDFIPIIFE
ncbi:Uncharacterised protein [Sebaldella termitidis]|uniref:Bacterial EndoU nuclease domain-containing protein n=1 Tax=Sebaldella termitidis (strain ATCC 33386 / NCTC 11300) TaxID=526218 RepID=D1AM27_SEBTE|nr:EndoU domain-containing protein [Sebaldella termitidis]ACZ07295.1 hypothetical protein Sterm_0413 [Sebaldella termitidis ATCC 33386]SUI22588.1 Uncharacterised protein [Sebaldella termitidis]